MNHPHDHLFSFFTPRAILRSAGGLVAFAWTRPRLFAQLALAGLRERRAFVRLLRLPIDLDTIRRSPLFDRNWYSRNRPDLATSRLSPELHYLLRESRDGRWSSPRFSGDAYVEQNPEVGISGVNPLVHYEQCGRFIDLAVSRYDAEPVRNAPPDGTSEGRFPLGAAAPRHRRTAVFATFSDSGRFSEGDLLYVRGLREVCDNVVVVSSAPMFPSEADRLEGMASLAIFRSHGGYDFGSYRIGMEAAESLGWLSSETCEELVFANSSCLGPIYPFCRMFDGMKRRGADFWGMTKNTQCCRTPYVQSFFLVFRRRILAARALKAFFAERPERITRREAISRFELELTPFLESRGFSSDSYVPVRRSRFREFNPTTRPLDLIRRWKAPLVKVKVFRGQSSQDPAAVAALLRRINPQVAALICFGRPSEPRFRRLEDCAAARDALAARIGARVRSGGGPVRTLFLVSSPAMFPARPLFEAMRRDPSFDARIAVVPDLRWPGHPPETAMEEAERELGAAFPGALLPPLRRGADGFWPDVLADFDLAVFPSPYDLSNYRYNPSRADDAGVLGISVNYSFSTSVYGYKFWGLQNHAYFWKMFFECDATAREYAEHSVLNGRNGEIVGYVKMDALASARPWPRNGNRKRVLICPHHSVEGGANDMLALSNFRRYADYFLALPANHPELDFVFRPHPFLFTVLSHPSKWGPQKVSDWIASMKANPNVRWSDEGDYFPAFASCDAIVHDCGSFLAEWFYTGKPCCFMLKDPADIDAKFAPLGKECLSHCYLAYDEAAIETFLRNVVIGGSDPKAAARDAFRKTIMVNHPHAADTALAKIGWELGMG